MFGVGALLRRLRGQALVRRWNFHYTTKDQNVAEHSYWVCVMAMLLCDMENLRGQDYNINEVMRGALLHDWEESITGDLPSLVKRICKEDWAKVEECGFEQLVDTLNEPALKTAYRGAWYLSRETDGNPEKERVRVLIKAADLLDRLAYAHDEQQRGNKSFGRIEAETVKQLREMGIQSVDDILDEWGFYGKGVELPKLMTHL